MSLKTNLPIAYQFTNCLQVLFVSSVAFEHGPNVIFIQFTDWCSRLFTRYECFMGQQYPEQTSLVSIIDLIRKKIQFLYFVFKMLNKWLHCRSPDVINRRLPNRFINLSSPITATKINIFDLFIKFVWLCFHKIQESVWNGLVWTTYRERFQSLDNHQLLRFYALLVQIPSSLHGPQSFVFS